MHGLSISNKANRLLKHERTTKSKLAILGEERQRQQEQSIVVSAQRQLAAHLDEALHDRQVRASR